MIPAEYSSMEKYIRHFWSHCSYRTVFGITIFPMVLYIKQTINRLYSIPIDSRCTNYIIYKQTFRYLNNLDKHKDYERLLRDAKNSLEGTKNYQFFIVSLLLQCYYSLLNTCNYAIDLLFMLVTSECFSKNVSKLSTLTMYHGFFSIRNIKE